MTKEELVARLQDIEWDDFEVKPRKRACGNVFGTSVEDAVIPRFVCLAKIASHHGLADAKW